MQRRLFLALPLALGIVPAGAQMLDPPRPDFSQSPPPEPMRREPKPQKGNRQRRRMTSRAYDDLSPKQRRRAQQAMARDGEGELPPEEARRRWDATPERQRRTSVKRVTQASGEGRARREGAMGEARQPRARESDAMRQ